MLKNSKAIGKMLKYGWSLLTEYPCVFLTCLKAVSNAKYWRLYSHIKRENSMNKCNN